MKVVKNWTECPKCRKNSLKGGFANIDDGFVWQTVTCRDCGFAWNEVYVLCAHETINGESLDEIEESAESLDEKNTVR
jgi:hypothetical protein